MTEVAQGVDTPLVQPTIRQLGAYFLKLGTFGFGGPIALVGHMQHDLVEQRRWFARQDFLEGLALAQLAPGPLAAQLAMYLGWLRAGMAGATIVSLAFVLPSFLMVLGLSVLYVHFGGLPWMQGLFYGIGAAVIGVIARSAVKLVKQTIGKRWLLWVIFAINCAVTAWTRSEIVWIVLGAGVLHMILVAPPGRPRPAAAALPPALVTGIHGAASLPVLGKVLVSFLYAGAFVFGSGLAVVPFLYKSVVSTNHWLTAGQFRDAVAVAMITPGPVVITVAFIGYLVAGPLGATAAAIGVFLPPFLIVILAAPYYRRFAANRSIRAFVDGVTAAATGAIAGSVYVLGRNAIVDVPTVVIALVALGVLSQKKIKIPEPLLIAAAGLVGLLLKGL
jgi:chromate transporter